MSSGAGSLIWNVKPQLFASAAVLEVSNRLTQRKVNNETDKAGRVGDRHDGGCGCIRR
jgi:hypothetical protein